MDITNVFDDRDSLDGFKLRREDKIVSLLLQIFFWYTEMT